MSLVSELGTRFKIVFFAKIIGVASGGILTVILSRWLEPDAYGLLFLAISILGIAGTFSKLGIAKSSARYIANYKENNPRQIPKIIQFGLLLNIISITIVSIIFILASKNISSWLSEPALNSFLLVGALYIIFSTLFEYVRITLQAFEDMKETSIVYIVDRSSRLIFALGLVFFGYGALGALVGYISAFILSSALGAMYIYYRHYRKVSPTQIEPGLRRRIAEYSVPLTATHTANVLDKRFDTVLIGFFLNPAAVAFYTISKQTIEFIETPLSALGFTLSPTYESEKSKGNIETAERIYEEALAHSLLLYIPAAIGLILVAEPLIVFIFGTQYLGAVPVLQVLAIYPAFQSITKLTSNGLDYLGRARERAIIKGTTSILNVFLNIILIPITGVIGAAIATVITRVIYSFANVYMMSKELDIRFKWLLHHIICVLGVTTAMAFAVHMLVGFVTGIVTLFAVVIIGIVIWAIFSVGFGLLDIRMVISAFS